VAAVRCLACILIREWERQRLEALKALEQTGVAPWIGAWNMKPESYVGGLGPSNVQEYVPVLGPGKHTPPATPAVATHRLESTKVRGFLQFGHPVVSL
jgi:hypothetical protein